MNKTEIPDWVIYPQEKWEQITPAQAGFDAVKFDLIVGDSQIEGARWEGEVHEEKEWGAVLTRGGYLVRVWGNPTYKYQTASVGKAFSRALVGLAVEAGLIQPDGVIWETWTGRNQLSHPHKHLDQQHHRTLTWNHLIGPKDGKVHYGGFPAPNGFYWRRAAYAHSKTSWGQGIYAPSSSTVDRGSPIVRFGVALHNVGKVSNTHHLSGNSSDVCLLHFHESLMIAVIFISNSQKVCECYFTFVVIRQGFTKVFFCPMNLDRLLLNP